MGVSPSCPLQVRARDKKTGLQRAGNLPEASPAGRRGKC